MSAASLARGGEAERAEPTRPRRALEAGGDWKAPLPSAAPAGSRT
jgi:hypothetical protein